MSVVLNELLMFHFYDPELDTKSVFSFFTATSLRVKDKMRHFTK